MWDTPLLNSHVTSLRHNMDTYDNILVLQDKKKEM